MSTLSKIEEKLLSIWRDILRVDELSVNDNFFQIGGDSILCIQMMSIADEMGLTLNISDIFEYPTISQLSLRVQASDTTNMSVAANDDTSQVKAINEKIEKMIFERDITSIVEDINPLTKMQSSILFRHLFDSSADSYVVQNLLKIEGDVNVDIFEKSWRIIHQNFPILKTAFIWDELEQPYQYVNKAAQIDWQIIDLSMKSYDVQNNSINELFCQDRMNSYDLETSNLCRFYFIIINDRQFYLLWSFHHILLDGWSSQYILESFMSIYRQLSNNVLPASLTILKPQSLKVYLDYINKNNMFNSEFWDNYFSGYQIQKIFTPEATNSHDSNNGIDVTELLLSSELTSQIQNIAKSESVSLNILMLAVWGRVINELYGNDDFCVGVVHSGRACPVKNIESITNVLINTLPLRITNESDSIHSSIQKIKKRHIELQSHSLTSIPDINKRLQLSSTDQLFDHLFIFENYPVNEQSQNNLGFQIDSVRAEETTEYPLSVVIIPDKQIKIRIVTKKSCLNKDKVLQIMDCFQQILLETCNTKSSHKLVSNVPNQLEGDIFDYEIENVITQFQTQCQLTPENIAIVFGETKVSYRELDSQVRTIAQNLKGLGIGRGDVVAICLPRSDNLIKMIMAILHVGGVYLPLDFKNPLDRNRYCLQVSAAKCLITTTENIDHYSKSVNMSCTLDNMLSHEHLIMVDLLKPTKVRQSDLAYIIFTSGTTGQPKGVMIEHGALNNYLSWCFEKYFIGTSGNTALFTSVAFDMTITTLFGSLAKGYTIYVLPENSYADALGEQIKNGLKFDLLKMTPSHLRALKYQLPDNVIGASVDCLVLGGEALLASDINDLVSNNNGIRIFNEYGPTEATVGCVVYEIKESITTDTIVPIGMPIFNTKLYLLNNEQQPAKNNEIAELYIAGDSLARGYIGSSIDSANKFIVPGKINGITEYLYRTGDNVKFNDNNELVYLGRIDGQVKINGYRIELPEIQFHVSQHHLVKNSAVVVQTEKSGIKIIIAYIILNDAAVNHADAVIELRGYLENKLPNYMIPKHFLFIDHLPLNSNGKLEQSMLPLPGDYKSNNSSSSTLAQLTDNEKKLSDIWKDILNVSSVSIEDDFFRLGGDSILSIQVSSRAKQQGLILTVRDVFKYPKLKDLASAAVVTKTSKGYVNQDVSGDFGLAPIQSWFFERNLADYNHFNQSMLLDVTTNISLNKLKEAITLIANRHDQLRAHFHKKENTVIQVVDSIDIFSQKLDSICTTKHLTNETFGHCQTLVELATSIQKCLDIYKGPLWRVVLIDDSNHNQKLLIVVHHLIIDAVSWRILLNDFNALLTTDSLGLELDEYEKTTSYQSWVHEISRLTLSDTYSSEIPYWNNVIQNIKKTFTSDTSESLCLEKNVKQNTKKLTPEDTTLLLRKVNCAFNTSINDVLLTALALSTNEIFGNSICSISLEGHGREQITETIDLSRTIGWFTSMYPVNLQINAIDYGQSLMTIKETLRAIPNKGIGFGILNYNRHNNSLMPVSQNPDICFNYLGQWDNISNQSSTILTNSDLDSGLAISPENSRAFILDVVSEIINGEFRITFNYDPIATDAETIQLLSSAYINHLTKIIHFCVDVSRTRYTPSDFPLANIEQAELDIINQTINGIEDIYAATDMQKGLILNDLLGDFNNVYIMQSVFEIRGDEIDEQALKNAWQQVIRRHPIFRTQFYWDGLDEPVQVVLQNIELPWSTFTYHSDNNTLDPKQFLHEILCCDRKSPLRVDHAPVYRLSLIKINQQLAYFVVTHHHAFFDAWCWSLIWSEVEAIYSGNLIKTNIKLSPARPYKEYIAWLNRNSKQQARLIWKEYLENYKPHNLPYDKAQNAADDMTSFYEYHSDVSRIGNELISFSRHHGVTSSIVLQLAWAMLLSKITSSQDVAFGLVSSGRDISLDGVGNIIGLFVNTLPIRILLPASDNIAAQLHSIQTSFNTMKEFSFISLSEIQAMTLNSAENSSRTLFDTVLVFENSHEHEGLPRNQLLQINAHMGIGRNEYPLTAVINPSAQFTVTLKGDKSHFSIDTLYKMSGEFIEIVETLIRTPTNTPASKDEYDRSDFSIYKAFKDQVLSSPEKICLKYNNQSMNYSELDMLISQFIEQLHGYNIKNGDSIAVLLPRSPFAIAALIAIHYIGGIYVPINHQFVTEQVQTILLDSAACCLITNKLLLNKHANLSLNCIITDAINSTVNNNQYSQPATDFDATAFIIYTSGSTGKPKGVRGNYTVITTRLSWMWQQFPLADDDVLFMWAPNHTIDCFWEMLGGLLQGVTTVIPDDCMMLDSDHLIKYLSDECVTRIDMVPSFLNMLLSEIDELATKLPALKFWGINGDKFSHSLIDKFFATLPDAKLLNRYGATEATSVYVQLFWYDKLAKQIHVQQSVTPHAFFEIINSELYIGGKTLASGYQNNMALTEKNFVEICDKNRVIVRAYKTGDTAKITESGELMLLGRKNNTLKIRGLTVNLHDIENALLSLKHIEQAIVVATRDQYDEVMLSAYIVSSEYSVTDHQTHGMKIRQELQALLPSHIVPQNINFIDKLPLNSNGKIDRLELESLSNRTQNDKAEKNNSAAHNQIVEVLADIWKNVLSIGHVNPTDNFFQLGGHSLLALRVLARVKRKYAADIPLRTIFDNPILVDLADNISRYVCAGPQNADESHSISTDLSANKTRFLASSMQKRLWIAETISGSSDSYHMNMILKISGALDLTALKKSFATLFARHSALRTHFEFIDNHLYQVVSDTKPFNIDCRKLSKSEEREIVDFTNMPLDIQCGPLFQVRLLCCSDKEHILLIKIHHMITDRWSNSILFKELNVLYTAYSMGMSIELTPVSQYYEYATLESSNGSNQTQLQYWKENLKNTPVMMNFPYDKERKSVEKKLGDAYLSMLDTNILTQLKELALEYNVSLFMLMLSFYSNLLSRFSQQNDIIIGTPVSNREHEQFENTIGFFANTLPLRITLSDEDTFQSHLINCRNVVLGAFENQQIPIDLIVDELHLPRLSNSNPLFQFAFVMQNTEQVDLNFSGLKINPVDSPRQAAKFDLTLIIQEHDDVLNVLYEYDAEIISENMIKQFADCFFTMIKQVLIKPRIILQDIEIVDANSIAQQSSMLCGPKIEFDQTRTILDQIVTSCTNAAHSPAVTRGNQSITYLQLDSYSNQLANTLSHLGVKVNTSVALLFANEIEAIISIVALLKLGACYIPLNVRNPSALNQHILNDSEVTLILTIADYTENCQYPDVQIVKLDSISWQTDNISQFHHSTKPFDPIYKIYTSGSTGTPKPVIVRHSNLINSNCARIDYYQDNPESFLLLSPIAFDSSVAGIFWTLATGGELILPDKLIINASEIKRVLIKHNVTHTLLLPSLYTEVLKMVKPTDNISSLRMVITAAEHQTQSMIAQHVDKLPHAQLYNEYGPTEATVWATVSKVYDKLSGQLVNSTVIGTPIANTQLQILNDFNQHSPLGCPGELCIIGKSVVLELNSTPYRTGDLVKLDFNGQLVLLGRKDSQLKHLGFRFHSSEIESKLSGLPYISEAVVLLKSSGQERQLVAYLTLEKCNYFDECDDVQFKTKIDLKKLLPDYMIPTNIVVLDSLPRLPNDKIDRVALTEMKLIVEDIHHVNKTELSQTAKLLLDIWGKILQLPAINFQDNFFMVGGNSFKAIQLASEIELVFNIQLSIHELFIHSSFEQMLRRIDEIQSSETSCVIDLNQDCTSDKNFFLIHQASGMAYPYLSISKYFTQIKLYGINNPHYGSIDEQFESVEDMAEFYIQMIKKIQPKGPYLIGGWSFGGVVALEMAIQLKVAGELTEDLVLIDSFNFAVRDKNKIFSTDQRNFITQYLIDRGLSLESSEAQSIINEFEHSYHLAANYKPGIYDGTVTLIKAATPLPISQEYWYDPLNGWLEHFTGYLKVLSIAGEHNHLFDNDVVLSLADLILESLSMQPENPKLQPDILSRVLQLATYRADQFMISRITEYYKKVLNDEDIALVI